MRYCQVCQSCFGDRVEYCLTDRTPTRLIPTLPLFIDHKYRLERMIARGGMGAVYRASHLALDRPVAVKILRPEFLTDATIRERFNREARAIARLKHPNVVSIYDYGLIQGDTPEQCGAFLVMELVEGVSLRQVIRSGGFRDGAAGLDRAALVMTQICAGVGAAHSHGIVHRDLKPDNIMIESPSGASERVLVLDFGIAKLTDGEQTLQGLTDEDTIIGTPNYISPEQVSGGDIDHRSDIYSLGVILFEMLTSVAPFSAPNTSATLLRHLQENPPPFSRYRPDLDGGFETIIRQALEKDPSRRYQSAESLARDFDTAARLFVESVETGTFPVDDLNPSVIQSVDTFTDPVEVSDEITRLNPALGLDRSNEASDIILNNEYLFTAHGILRRADHRMAKGALAVFSIVLAILLTGVYLSLQDPARARNPVAGVQLSAVEASGGSDVIGMPVSYPTVTPAVSDLEIRELRSIYRDWTFTAIRGDWKHHSRFYDNRVDYFRDGKLSRSRVEARKRAIFSGVDSFELKFSEIPAIRFRRKGDTQFADLTYQRRWRLRRGKKRVEGRANGMITLRRGSEGWLIISEKQLGKQARSSVRR